MTQRKIPQPKPLLLERMQKLLTDKEDYEKFLEVIKVPPVNSIRCNTLKISPDELKKRLEEKGWKISQPWKKFSEVMIIENELMPGELGRSLEHLLGYYYVQELVSMLPVLVLDPQEKESVLDLCASPGSKTTQIASKMNDQGNLIANEPNLDRLRILASNLERCGVSNTIITRRDGRDICENLKEKKIFFDKILVDAPCSGEGTLRSSPKTALMWNIHTIKKLPKIQEKLVSESLKVLKKNGILVYSTCTHAPEEDEGVVNAILEKFKNEVILEEIELPLKTREGITRWEQIGFSQPKGERGEGGAGNSDIHGESKNPKIIKYSDEVKKCHRIYPQDNNTEGFFVARFKKIK